MDEPVWIDKTIVLAIHQLHLNEFGGKHGVNSDHLLESALAKPQHIFYYQHKQVDIARLAAAYAFGLWQTPPFYDGNKRTALLVCEAFLRFNHKKLQTTKEEKYTIIMQLANGILSEDALCAWIQNHI